MDDNRRKALDEYIKQLKQGIPFSEDFIERSNDIYDNALLSRNLSEDALARQVLNETGISIPDDNAPRLKKEDFLNRLIQERYPELKDPNIRLDGNQSYYSTKDGIYVANKPDTIRNVSDALHENAHRYDDVILGYDGKPISNSALRQAKASGVNLKEIDPTQAYEILGESHHAKIPKLREGTFGYGALKSMLKSGTFKAIPVVGPAIAAYSALDSGDASAAIPVLDSAESVGVSGQDERQMLKEHDARINYDKSQARRDALKKIGQ